MIIYSADTRSFSPGIALRRFMFHWLTGLENTCTRLTHHPHADLVKQHTFYIEDNKAIFHNPLSYIQTLGSNLDLPSNKPWLGHHSTRCNKARIVGVTVIP